MSTRTTPCPGQSKKQKGHPAGWPFFSFTFSHPELHQYGQPGAEEGDEHAFETKAMLIGAVFKKDGGGNVQERTRNKGEDQLGCLIAQPSVADG